MRYFRFWSRSSEHQPVLAFGYSNESEADALRMANERAAAAQSRWERGDLPAGHYAYHEQTLREELIEEFHHRGVLSAIITRNAYGALILNTERVFFADLDFPPANHGSFWSRLWGKPRPDRDAVIMDRIRSLVGRAHGVRFRVYRTAAGFRCLLLSDTWSPEDGISQRWLRDLQSDPLYEKLCRAQSCFRARLTPKPWRMGMPLPPDRIPFQTTETERAYRAWVDEYDRQRTGYATCAMITEIGEGPLHPEADEIAQLHDHFTCGTSEPLA